MSSPKPIPLWDRRLGKLTQEFMTDSPATYESRPHRSLTNLLQSHPAYDWLVSIYQNTQWSARKIEPFIREHHVDMGEFEPGPYCTYARFFERRFKPGARSFPAEKPHFGAFAEARYLGWERLQPKQEFPIKGCSLSAPDLLGNETRARPFEGGPVIVARLAPVDYHHLHYPDDGETLEEERLGKKLWTVNQHALRSQPDILFRNERKVQVLSTTNFGRLGFVEIGALSVGRIVQTHPPDQKFNRGAEKSVFRFGGSAVVVFGESGAWLPSEDILRKTTEGIEAFIRLGETIAMSCPAGKSHHTGPSSVPA
jgi:phosphatidylserine decarboxylase